VSEKYSDALVLSIVVPVYCESACLEESLMTIAREARSLREPFEIVVVDDGSTDDTWAILRKVCNVLPMIRGIRLSRNFGKEAAIAAGLEAAIGSAVIVMDADLQHPPELIPEMVRRWRESDADIIDGVKTYPRQESLMKRLRTRLFYSLLTRLSGYELTGASDYKLLDRRVVDAWSDLQERDMFFRGMTAWLGFRHSKIAFTVSERAGGSSKWSLFHLSRLAVTAVTAFSALPLHLITVAGIAFFVFAVGLAAQTLFNWIRGVAVTGFTTVILLLLIIGSGIMIGLGIVGEYIYRIYNEVKRRPRYLVSDKIGRDVH